SKTIFKTTIVRWGNRMRFRYVGVLALAVVFFVPAAAVRAQVPFLAKGNQEINGFGGLSYGLDHWRGSFGGNYAYGFSKYLMVYGEYSYFPGIVRKINPIPNVSPGGNTTFKFHDVHGGVHIRLPIFPEKHFVPYLSGG